MTPIRQQFKRKGFNYRQIAREGDWAIYEQRWQDSDNLAYEVVKIRPGRGLLEGQEIYPSSGEWGTYGFTVTDKDRAFEKLRSVQ